MKEDTEELDLDVDVDVATKEFLIIICPCELEHFFTNILAFNGVPESVSGFTIRIGIQEGKNYPQKWKKKN